MADMKFTPAQQNAIDASGGSVIVSAGAGSGKTRVLVQRVIRLLTDQEHPVDADHLLIVTFTKAAAEEMRSRIASAIEKRLFYEPDNVALRRQQLLLASADICTIHSFCSKVIRENFYLLDINQDFRIISGGEADVLRRKVLSELIEEQYQQKESGFLLLSELLSSSKSDVTLEKTLLDVYEKSSSHPFPSQWLDMVASFYDPAVPVGQTVFAKKAYEQLNTMLPYMDYLLRQAETVITHNDAFCTGTKTCGEKKLTGLKKFIRQLREAAAAEDWDDLSDCINGFEKISYRKPDQKKYDVSEEECTAVKASFDAVDELIESTFRPIFGIDSAAYREDTRQLYPAVQALCTMLKTFEERYFAAKKEKGMLDFSDLEHLMLRLLVKNDENGSHPTEFARNLSRQYDQIMVDEYQDTNETQECIFRYVSQEEKNLFVVGDIKQSIYRFRQARPEIFKNRRKAAVPYCETAPQFPAKIILDHNFRSRKGVIDSINFIFHTIMSERVGEITYNEEEALTAGAAYPDWQESPVGLYLLDHYALNQQMAAEGKDKLNAAAAEARYIAQLIREKIDSGLLVTEDGRQRPAQYGDFAVLMRFLSTNGQDYADTLTECGIPAYIDKPYSLFGCYEVNILIAYLKIIDNPLQDIPMIAVLLHPVYGFTADDLADIKAEPQGKFIFNKLRCFLKAQQEHPEQQGTLYLKINRFLKDFNDLRRLSVTVAVSKVLDAFFDKTCYLPIMTAAEHGDIRLKNIRKFLGFVQEYEKNGKAGLTEFVRYLNYLEENGTDISVNDTVPSNAVKIMSIHHSKGLEFPVCILAGLNAKGGSDQKDEILCHADWGFGMKIPDRQRMLKFNSLQRNVIELCQNAENMSEAMRVLYVAMTRAKEKLIAVIDYPALAEDSLYKKLNRLAAGITVEEGRLSPYVVERTDSLADWFVLCALVHPSMEQLRLDADGTDLPILPSAETWEYHLVSKLTEKTVRTEDTVSVSAVDAGLSAFLQKRFEETYRFEERIKIPSKVSASALVHTAESDKHIAATRPAFMQEEQMTGAEKGTAMHTFLQYVDFSRLEQDTEQEKQRLVQHGFLTAEQAGVIDTHDIESFLQSPVYADIRQADQVCREYCFTVNLPASVIDPSYPEEEQVILQGAMDCLLMMQDGIIIIDYKTDKIKNAEALAQKYRTQLLLYKEAAGQLFSLPVKKCCIYSIYQSKVIDIDS